MIDALVLTISLQHLSWHRHLTLQHSYGSSTTTLPPSRLQHHLQHVPNSPTIIHQTCHPQNHHRPCLSSHSLPPPSQSTASHSPSVLASTWRPPLESALSKSPTPLPNWRWALFLTRPTKPSFSSATQSLPRPSSGNSLLSLKPWKIRRISKTPVFRWPTKSAATDFSLCEKAFRLLVSRLFRVVD